MNKKINLTAIDTQITPIIHAVQYDTDRYIDCYFEDIDITGEPETVVRVLLALATIRIGEEATETVGASEPRYFLFIDPETGEAKEFLLECRMAAARGGYLYGIENGSEDNFGTIVKYSLSGQTYERIPVTGPSGDWLVDNKGFFLSPDGSQAALATSKDTLCRIDLQTGDCEPFKEEAANANYFIWSEDSSHYATISNTMINIHKADGTPVSQIPTGGRYYCFAQFEGDYLYVAYGNARLFRYRITDGQEEGVADIALYVNDKDNGNLTFTDEYLYLNAGSGTGRMSTIDLSQMKRINDTKTILRQPILLAAVIVVIVLLVLFVVYPLLKVFIFSLTDESGGFYIRSVGESCWRGKRA